jgi:hypothetical protein
MSVNQAYPVLDGVAPSWADVSVKLIMPGGVAGASLLDMNDIKSINTGTSLEVGEQVGASGGRVIKRTWGKDKHEASWTLYASGYNKMIRGLASAAPSRGNQRLLRAVHFGINFQLTPFNSTEIWETRIKGCFYAGRAFNLAEGTDAATIDVALNPLQIVDMIDGQEIVII